MNRNDTGREAEELYLRETLQIIDRNLASYRQEVTRMQADIDEMLEHYHDNDTEVWTLLNNTITLNEHMKRALMRNERAKQKPYFGRIIFHDETLNREESLYIGKGGISADRTSQRVVDWRAPVANAYYENGLGKCSYTAPDGKELPIDLKLKRTYELAEGKLLDYFDTEVVANDDLLMKYLSKNKEAVLGEIVATIRKEQNEIIRKSPFHNIIVQGVAGSGKTTVAMHRISFILYNYQERFRPEDFYIVGSNRILLDYITGVLPDLDVYGVKQMTMEQLFIRLLYEDWDEKSCHVRPLSGVDTVKGTQDWYQELLFFIRRLEQQTIPQETVSLNPRQFVEGLQNGKNGIYDKTKEDRRAGRKPVSVRLVEADSIRRYITQNPSVSLQSKINMLNDRLTVKIKEEFLGKGVKYTAEERKAILRAYRGYYGKPQWKTSIYELYRQFLLEQREKGYTGTIPENDFDVYDLAALALLYKLVKETEVISEAHHIVIDEAQDFGMMAYHVLHDCIKDCTYTVMGDISQNIHFGFGLSDWKELQRLLLADDPAASFGVLKKSYRNTVEISDFTTMILRHGNFSIYPVEPIIRHGKPVVVECSSEKAFALRTAEICRRWQSEGLETIAVVCRDTDSAARAAAELSKQLPILESNPEKADFGSGIMVLPVEYTKGLEFDAVLIFNPTRENYPTDDGHAKLLYVAATRALHELHILHTGNLTGLIADPVPENRTQRANDVRTDPSGKQADAGNMETDPKTSEAGSMEIAAQTKTMLRQNKAAKPETSLEDLKQTAGTESRNQPETSRDNVKGRSAAKVPTAETQPRVKPRIVIATANPAAVPAKGHDTLSAKASKAASAIVQTKASVPTSRNVLSFGDMPPTETLRPAGHAKISLGVRWASRQPDGLYLQSQYGILRISPVGSAILRLTFSKTARITDTVHPLIRVSRQERDWKFKDNGRQLTLMTKELCVEIDKASGSARYLDPTGKVLLSERKTECRQIEGKKNRIFFDWQKGEQLYAIGSSGQEVLKLRGSARVLSVPGQLPFVLSDRGYAILPATTETVISCDIAAYGSYLGMEGQEQQDYYLIVGREHNIRNAYAYLTGNL